MKPSGINEKTPKSFLMSAPTEIRKSILIIKSQSKSLTAVESFLKNRGWKIHATTDLKDALQYLVQGKPSFVMISVDHPNKKVRVLPKLLVQSFPVFVMGFSESNTTVAYKALIDSGAPYRINPPITGPAVERTINKIIRDQEVEREKAAAAERAKIMSREMSEAKAKHEHEASAISSHSEKNPNAVSFGGVEGVMSNSDSDITTITGKDDGGAVHIQGGGKPRSSTSAADLLKKMADVSEGEEHDEESENALLSVLQSAAQDHHNDDAAPISQHGAIRASASDVDPSSHEGGGVAYMPDGTPKKKRGSQHSESEAEDGDEAGLMVAKGSKGPGGSIRQEGPGGGDINYHDEGKKTGPAGFIGQDAKDDDGGGLLMPDGQHRDGPAHAGGNMGHTTPGKRPKHKSAGEDPAAAMQNGAEDSLLQKSPEAKAKSDRGGDVIRRPNEKPQAQYSEEDFESSAPAESDEAAPLGRKKEKADLSVLEPLDLNREKKKKSVLDDNVVRRIPGKATGWQKEDNIIVRGTQQALDDSVDQIKGNDKPAEKISGASNVACLVVESDRFSGYLVAALGKNRKMDNKFVDTLRDRLSKFLKDNGEPMADDKSMQLKIKPVDFEDWALEYADFLRKSVHEGEEIAMAFFPFAQAKTMVETSAQADMGAVKIDELQGDLSVDFNLYVYLPANKKYVLYTPRGSKFYGNQKDRLARMGVTHMHVKRTELQDVSKYRAQNYLNSKIQEYEKKKTGKSQAS